MRSPLAALTWEIWRRGRRAALLAAGCIALAAAVNLTGPARLATSSAGHALFGLLMVSSFLLTMGIYNYTEPNPARDWRGFPYRLFATPVSTWRLVTIPMLLGVGTVELVYLAWIKLVWTHEMIPMAAWFAVVLGACMVFYQTVLWSLAGFRILCVIVLGLGGVSCVGVLFLPVAWDFPALSEQRLIPVMSGLALVSYFTAWAVVARQRCGGGSRRSRIKALLDKIGDALPRRAIDFASPAGAQFWYEWRRAGFLLPVCAALVLVAIFAPVSWIYRHDARTTVSILVRILATPVVLAFAIGKGFVKPEFWSMNLSAPSFLAVRPLSSGEITVSKMKVAALSVAITWVLVLAFIGVWLGLWADTSQLNEPLFNFRLMYPRAWLPIVVLTVCALVTVTWRCMVDGLWSGLSGKGRYYYGATALQVIVPVLLLLACAIWSDKIDRFAKDHPDYATGMAMPVVGWVLAAAVVFKFWFAVFSWSNITPRCASRYLLIWSAATAGFVALAILSAPVMDTYRWEHLYVLGALLLFPFSRLGLAPSMLAGNRHR